LSKVSYYRTEIEGLTHHDAKLWSENYEESSIEHIIVKSIKDDTYMIAVEVLGFKEPEETTEKTARISTCEELSEMWEINEEIKAYNKGEE